MRIDTSFKTLRERLRKEDTWILGIDGSKKDNFTCKMSKDHCYSKFIETLNMWPHIQITSTCIDVYVALCEEGPSLPM